MSPMMTGGDEGRTRRREAALVLCALEGLASHDERCTVQRTANSDTCNCFVISKADNQANALDHAGILTKEPVTTGAGS